MGSHPVPTIHGRVQVDLYKMDLFGLYGMVGFFYRLNMQENAENICYGSAMKIKSWDQENLIYIVWNGLLLKGIILRHLGMI